MTVLWDARRNDVIYTSPEWQRRDDLAVLFADLKRKPPSFSGV